MKKLKLLLAACAMLLTGGMTANAYTTSDLTSAGWTQVTALSDVDNYYYVFVDADASTCAMVHASSNQTDHAVFATLENPFAIGGEVWKIAADGSNYTIQSVLDDYYYNSGNAGWNCSMSSTKSNASLSFTLANGKYNIQATAVAGNNYLGPWNNDGHVQLADGIEGIAANKGASQAPGFHIYQILRTTYDSNRINGTVLASNGWAMVTSASGLGLTGYYYAILDASENGIESGYALTGTGGRPTYTPLTDPITNTAQKWTMEAHGEGYAIKDMSSNKYVYSAANWNMQATDNINTSNTDYIPAYVSDGRWTLSNSISKTEFVGTYSNTNYQPFNNEGTASNKAANAGKRQFIFYSIPTIAGIATALPVSGDMAADTWYYIDINAAAANYNATATTLTNIVYTTDGTLLYNSSAVTDKFTVTDNSLSARRYYVKSSSANNLVIGVASYTYTVGEATTDVNYIQAGNTVTVTYADFGTNDPGASADINFSGITFNGNALPVTPTSNGFTFTVPAVTANTDYTLSIPANAIGYDAGSIYNDAQNITLHTPAVFDGVYYMYNNNTQNYISRSGSYATQAIMDNYGIAFNVSTDANNNTKLQYFDSQLWLGDDNDCYGDCSGDRVRSFTVSVADGGYKLMNTNNSKYLAVSSGHAVANAEVDDASNIWTFESTTSHVANYTRNADTQAATAAAAIGQSSITTKAALETYLAENYGETPITITGAKAEKWQVYAGNSIALSEATYYSETVNDLTPGLYKLSVDAFQRAASNERVAGADGARSIIYLYAGTAKTQIKSLMDAYSVAAYIDGTNPDYEYNGKHYPNSQASAYVALANLDYSNDVYVYVADAGSGTGSLEIGIKNPTRLGGNYGTWAVYNNWTLTYYEPKATASEKAALSAAISSAEVNTLGFENSEYAPYNNVDAINALVTAKALNPETASGAAVVAATTALTGATWTPNVGEVNAIYNPTFALSENDGAMVGWQNSNTAAGLGGATHSRAFVLTSGMTNYGNLVKFEQGDGTRSVAYVRFDSYYSGRDAVYTYGATTGYTMPLKAKAYRLKAQMGSWNQANKKIKVSLVADDDTEVVGQTKSTVGTLHDNTGSVTDFDIIFPIASAGDYKLKISNPDDVDNAIVITNFELKSIDALEFADGAAVPTYAPGTYPSVKITRELTADRWATAVYPFSVPAETGRDVAILSSYSEGTLGFTSGASTANKPFLMRSTANASEIELSDVAVAAADATDATAGDASLKGVYAATAITNAQKNFVLSNNTIYPVGSAGATINPYRAYIQTKESAGARSLRFVIDGEETTAIEGINAAEKAEGEAFNLAGQRVKSLKKGLYIRDGKKVVVK